MCHLSHQINHSDRFFRRQSMKETLNRLQAVKFLNLKILSLFKELLSHRYQSLVHWILDFSIYQVNHLLMSLVVKFFLLLQFELTNVVLDNLVELRRLYGLLCFFHV
jgi:hypothetical protein